MLNDRLENVAIANALQLEAARRRISRSELFLTNFALPCIFDLCRRISIMPSGANADGRVCISELLHDKGQPQCRVGRYGQ